MISLNFHVFIAFLFYYFFYQIVDISKSNHFAHPEVSQSFASKITTRSGYRQDTSGFLIEFLAVFSINALNRLMPVTVPL